VQVFGIGQEDVKINEILLGDIREIAPTLPTGSVNCIVTSPPYWGLRSYLDNDDPDKGLEIGAESTPEEYVETMVSIFRELRRVLVDDGNCWVNIGDSYASGEVGRHDKISSTHLVRGEEKYNGVNRQQRKNNTSLPSKNLVGIPWRVALALQADGWILRSDIIWSKPNPMPESVTDRPTKAHEYIFLLAKQERYYYDADAIREPHNHKWWYENVGAEYMTPSDGRNDGGKRKGNGSLDGRNKRTVWEVTPQPYAEAHFATFPPELIRPCILAGCPAGGVVLDPFFGSGTTGQVCVETGRNWLGVELNPKYITLAKKRIAGAQPPLIVWQTTAPAQRPAAQQLALVTETGD
jgi:DNA modification methylase